MLKSGKCVSVCGNAGEPCPCCGDFECIEGVCREKQKEAEKPKTAKGSMMWVGLLGLAVVGVYALSQGGKKRRPNRPRRPGRRRRSQAAYA